MVDAYLILAPILLLGVVALLRFIGCTSFGATPEPAPPPSPPTPSTKITLTGSPDPSSVGEFVAFIVTVKTDDSAAAAVTSGNVDFKEGLALLGTVALDGSGNATFKTTFASSGTHSIQAVYAGVAGQFIPSLSSVWPQIVNPGPIPGLVTVTFDADALGPAPPGVAGTDTINGKYKNINFGANQWIWQGPVGAAPGNSIRPNYGGAGDISETFSFANGRRKLRAIRVFVEIDPSAAQTPDLTLTDDNSPALTGFPQQKLTQNIKQVDGLTVVDTSSWANPSGTVTVRTTLGQYFHLDRIVYEGPA
jgi:hypothetical protein